MSIVSCTSWLVYSNTEGSYPWCFIWFIFIILLTLTCRLKKRRKETVACGVNRVIIMFFVCCNCIRSLYSMVVQKYFYISAKKEHDICVYYIYIYIYIRIYYTLDISISHKPSIFSHIECCILNAPMRNSKQVHFYL